MNVLPVAQGKFDLRIPLSANLFQDPFLAVFNGRTVLDTRLGFIPVTAAIASSLADSTCRQLQQKGFCQHIPTQSIPPPLCKHTHLQLPSTTLLVYTHLQTPTPTLHCWCAHKSETYNLSAMGACTCALHSHNPDTTRACAWTPLHCCCHKYKHMRSLPHHHHDKHACIDSTALLLVNARSWIPMHCYLQYKYAHTNPNIPPPLASACECRHQCHCYNEVLLLALPMRMLLPAD